MEVITSANPSVTAAAELNEVLTLYATQPVLLMLSGGSAILILEQVDVSLLGPHVTITTLDERFSTDPTVNNFVHITTREFYTEAMKQGAKTISTEVVANQTLSEAGERFNTALHHWRARHPDGVVITTMGVGSDGHTAGIFPHHQGLDFETTNWVVAYEVSRAVNSYTKRITVTPFFLKTHITQAICLVMGAAKYDVLKNIQGTNCVPTDIPACIMKDMSSVTIVTELAYNQPCSSVEKSGCVT